jgi:spore germination protein YaaH
MMFRLVYTIVAVSCLLCLPCLLQADQMPEHNKRPLVLVSQHPLLGAQIPLEYTQNHALIDVLAPMWVAVDDHGDVSLMDHVKQPIDVYVQAAHKQGTAVWPIVRNFAPMPLLGDPQAIARCAAELEQWAVNNKVDGLVIDFENLTKDARLPYISVMKALYARFKARNLKLAAAVQSHLFQNELDYLAMSQSADYLYVMFYDYAGPWNKIDSPTAPLYRPDHSRDIDRDLQFILKQGVNPDLLLFGLATYGLDMTLDASGQVTHVDTRYIQTLLALQQKNDAQQQWDASKHAAYFEYTDQVGAMHRVWYENAQSYQEKLQYLRSKGIAGVGIWAIRWADQLSSASLWSSLESAR